MGGESEKRDREVERRKKRTSLLDKNIEREDFLLVVAASLRSARSEKMKRRLDCGVLNQTQAQMLHDFYGIKSDSDADAPC